MILKSIWTAHVINTTRPLEAVWSSVLMSVSQLCLRLMLDVPRRVFVLALFLLVRNVALCQQKTGVKKTAAFTRFKTSFL